MVEWKKFIEYMSTQGLPPVNEEEQIIMKYVLGNVTHNSKIKKKIILILVMCPKLNIMNT
jgi:hypothetical protein